ncbi:MAG TPA: cupin domain-containing protein [Solirubrobacteraceae bacterium]|nr:cupin domain-containing protein [Solirubrobacteraceae bacterium]
MGIAHLEDVPARERIAGHLQGRWTMVGVAAGCVNVGVRRIEVPVGGWSTPAHEHGREEEIFYVLGGRGLSWHGGEVYEVHAGDCIVYLPGAGAHTLHALEPLDVLAFGERFEDESVGFPRLGMSYVGSRLVGSLPGAIDGLATQFVLESQLGPPPLPRGEPAARPPTIVNVEDVEAVTVERPRVVRTRRNLGRAAGSVTTGIQHVQVAPGKESAPAHCHSLEEEIFVVLDGDGVLVLRGPHPPGRAGRGGQQTPADPGREEEETPVRPGHVISRAAGTGVAHMFRAGDSGLTYLAYGMRHSGDACYYPRSDKVAFRGLGLVARMERLDYWDGED